MIAQLKRIRWRIVPIALFIILWIQGPARLNGMALPLTQEVPCKSSEKDSSREDCIPNEITFEAQRAGSDRYRYIPGLGFEIRPRLGLAGSFEYFSELKKIEDLTIVTGLEFPSADDRRDKNIRPFLEPVQTRSALIQATIRIFSKTRFRYTALIKDFDLTFKEEDRFRWRLHNFDISKGFSLLKHRYALVVNPIFERRTITKKNDQTDEIENVFLLQFLLKRCKGGELNVQLSSSKLNAQDTTDAKINNRFSRFEFRKSFPGLRSLLTIGWFHGRSEFLPSGDILTKDELYLDSGIDFSSRRLRDGFRLIWARIFNDRKSHEDLTARSLAFENKISYEVLRDSGWDISTLQFYGKDFEEPARYDFLGLAFETELYIQTGLLHGTRATLSFAIYHYRHLEQTERIFTLRLHPFRF